MKGSRFATVALLCASLMAQASMAEDFVFNGRPIESRFQLQDQITHTIYEDRVVPATCYRQDVIDHREECSTTYTQECTDHPRQECTDVPRHECTQITRTECRDTTRQECRNVDRRVCTPTTRRECTTENRRQCRNVSRNVCNNERVCRDVQEETCRVGADGQRVCVPYTARRCTEERVCRDVNEQECTNVPEEVCRNVPAEVCRTTTERECSNVPDRVCTQVPDQVCRTYNDRQCRTVNDRQCRQVPHETCQTVPVYGRVPYDCSRTERVPVREELDFNVQANVAVNFAEGPADAQANERMSLTLDGDALKLACTTPSNKVLLLAKKNEFISTPAPKEKLIEASFNVSSVATQAVVSHVSKPIQGLALTSTQVKFVIGQVKAPRFLMLGMQLIKQAAGNAPAVTLFSRELPQQAFQLRNIQVSVLDAQRRPVMETRTEVTVVLADLQLPQAVGRATYKVVVASRLNAKAMEGLMNPASLPQVQFQKTENVFNLAR